MSHLFFNIKLQFYNILLSTFNASHPWILPRFELFFSMIHTIMHKTKLLKISSRSAKTQWLSQVSEIDQIHISSRTLEKDPMFKISMDEHRISTLPLNHDLPCFPN